MALIQWKPELSVKIRRIDEEHQRLIQLTNDLDEAMGQGKSKAVMGTIVAELARYTRTHFSYEQDLFAQHSYPDAPAHLAEHEIFVGEISRFAADFEAGRLGLSIQVMNFLSEWLTTHIKGTDRKYTDFFNQRGVN
ncbi:MAG: bacteriohemerythrin [Acidobacteriota bacterium]